MDDPKAAFLSDVDAALKSVVPKGCTWSFSSIVDAQVPLFIDEEDSIATAVLSRQAEFRAGRSVARAALAMLGLSPVSVPRSTDRRPIWPTGIVGSIAHSGGWVGALAGRSSEHIGLGIDFEPAATLSKDLQFFICNQDEIELRNQKYMSEIPFDFALMVFVAKEAAFKATYHLVNRYMDFKDASVIMHVTSTERDCYFGKFDIKIHNTYISNSIGMNCFTGKWFIVGNHFFAVTNI